VKVSLKPSTLDLSVVIPSLNEARNLARHLPLLRESLDELGVSWQVIVVDGDSGDDTRSVVTEAGAKYVLEPAPGYGTAIVRGITEADGAYVITMDADLSHPVQFVRQLWEARHGADIIIASRYVEGGKAEQPWLRFQLSRVLNGFFRAGLSFPVNDMSSGFRLYRKELFRDLDLTFTNFVILVEVLLRAYQKGMHIREVPFHYRPRTEGTSHARVIKFGMDYLRLFHRMWRIRNSIEFPDYDWRAYNSRIPLQRYWQRTRHRLVTGFVPSSVSTLDVGCGSSKILADLPDAVGLDIRHEKLAFMRKTNRLLVQGDGCKLPFADGAFECVICSQVIEHVPDENGRLIDELTRVLEPDGTLVLGTPDYGRWEWRVTEKIYNLVAPGAYGEEHVTRYSFASVRETLLARGYKIADYAYICRGELIVCARKGANTDG